MKLALSCEVQKYENFIPVAVRKGNSDLLAVEYVVSPIASLRIPAGFSKIAASHYGTTVLGNHPKGIIAVLGYETKEIVSAQKDGVTPADFMLSVFQGNNKLGCHYLEGQRLADEDYRLHAKLEGGADLYAYGTLRSHHFYVIRMDKPNYVMSGTFKNISRSEFEAILSTIKTQ